MSRLLKLVYAVVYSLTLPWSLYRLAVTRDLGSLAQRLGVPAGEPLTDSIWLHASSVGEVVLLAPLVAGLERAYPNLPIVISAYTRTGRETARSRYARHRVIAFPFDYGFALRRYLRRYRPRIVVVAESELWPRFLTELSERRIPTLIVNARMSEKSFRVHARTRFVAQALKTVSMIAVQSPEHRARLNALGVDPERIEVTGNMKFDLLENPLPDAGPRRERLGLGVDELVVVGGSLHAGEDEALLEAAVELERGGQPVRLIIVPRYPADAARIMVHGRSAGLDCVLKSELDRRAGSTLGERQVLIVDTLGELRQLYRLADIAFVGGSLFYRGSNKGGHNLMEPAICGIPVLFGRYNYSFREIAADLVAADAGIEIDAAPALVAAFAGLGCDPERRRAMGARARRLVLAGRGATARNLAVVGRLLAAQGH